MKKLAPSLLMLLLCIYLPAGTQTTPFTGKFGFRDMFRIKKVSSPRLSPDGRYVVYETAEADTTADRWVKHLWRATVAGGETIQLTGSENGESHPRWTPNGSAIAFLSKRDDFNNIHLLPMEGGEAHLLFRHPADIRSFEFAPGGNRVYFLAQDTLTRSEKAEEESHGGAYFVDENEKPVHLWVYDRRLDRVRQLTNGKQSVSEFCLSARGEQIFFVAAPGPRLDLYLQREIYRLDATGGTPKRLTENGIAESQIRWSPDGKYISFVSDASNQLEPYYQESIFLLDLQTRRISDLLPDFGYQVFDYFWTARGRQIYFIANTGVNVQLFRLDRSKGGLQQLTSTVQEIRSLHYQPGLNRLAYLQSTPEQPYDVYIADLRRLPGRRLTQMNAWLQHYPRARYRTLHWQSPDGHRAEGLLILPPKGVEKNLPLIVQLHGGPESSYRNYFGSSWSTYPQIWAARGYALFQPNYRGSTGYGDEVMRSIIGHYFEKDIDDIISGVDYLVAQGIADPQKMAVMGWSAGGHLTNWIVTHFQRFKAACSGAGGANWASFYAQTDMQYIREIWHLGPPYSRQEFYRKKSPVSYVGQAKTPTLILCGEEDRRVPFAQSLEMYRGLKRNGCPVRFVAFPGEPHGLRKLKHQLHKMRLEFQWIEKYLFNRDWELGDLN